MVLAIKLDKKNGKTYPQLAWSLPTVDSEKMAAKNPGRGSVQLFIKKYIKYKSPSWITVMIVETIPNLPSCQTFFQNLPFALIRSSRLSSF